MRIVIHGYPHDRPRMLGIASLHEEKAGGFCWRFYLEITSDTHTEAVNPTTSTWECDGLGDVPIGVEVIELSFEVRVEEPIQSVGLVM